MDFRASWIGILFQDLESMREIVGIVSKHLCIDHSARTQK
jgi:hypothetical protein